MIWVALLLLLFVLVISHKYAWWAKTIDYKYPRILMYHMIREAIPGTKFNGLRVSPRNFERQLAMLKANGWEFVTMSTLFDDSIELSEKTVAITFDDGFEDNYTHAFPLLKKYHAKATLYLVVDRVNNDWSTNKKTHHSSGELMQEPKLTDQQVQEMLGSGVFELGAHTLSHANLQALDLQQKLFEIEQSKSQLEEKFRVKVESFAYPFGIFDEQDCKIVADNGFSNAVTTENGVDTNLKRNNFRLKRLKVSGKDNSYAFKLRLTRGRRGFNK
ncbi:MAG: polysaccharide deacetylase family protein [Pseudomonadales bacterium]|nr:polysaccharide deacetylase family protein [Pseudomonadales bacterium]